MPPVVVGAGRPGRLGGCFGLVWGFLVCQVLFWHGTFTINSLSHVFGTRRYATRDDSRNNWLLALITLGEGWHNNHHHYPASARQGFRWWEIDLTYYVLRAARRGRPGLGPARPSTADPPGDDAATADEPATGPLPRGDSIAACGFRPPTSSCGALSWC